MRIEHVVEGSKETSLHDFIITTNNMEITVSKGNYYQAGNNIFTSETGATISILSPIELTHYEIWLTGTGIQVLQRTDAELFAEVTNPIDRLAWFSVPANTTNLDNIDIHFVKVVET